MNEGAPGSPSLEWLEQNKVVSIEQGEREHWTHDMIARAYLALEEDDGNEADDM